MKIHPVGADLLYADGWMDGWMDGWTDRHRQADRCDKANSCFSQFCDTRLIKMNTA